MTFGVGALSRPFAGAGAPSAEETAHLRRLSARDFRNFAGVEVALPAAGGVFVGENGQGKTNLLEAIYYAHLFRSMRGARDDELVRFGAAGFHLGLDVAGLPVDAIGIGYDRATRRKRVVLDGVPAARLSNALGALPCVAFAPADVQLVSGGPGFRRLFLDLLLASTSRRYLVALQGYRQALLQRNAAIRHAGRSPDAARQLGAWEPPLAEAGAILRRARLDWVAWARPQYESLGAALGEADPAELRYRGSADLAGDGDESALREQMAAALAQHRAPDLQRGTTTVGPHRDDLDLRLGGHAVRRYGSAGQQRLAAIALRLLEGWTVRTTTGREPVVLLDDPLAELDGRRAALVLERLAARTGGQTVLAVPRPDDVPAAFAGLARFRVHGGTVTPWRDP